MYSPPNYSHGKADPLLLVLPFFLENSFYFDVGDKLNEMIYFVPMQWCPQTFRSPVQSLHHPTIDKPIRYNPLECERNVESQYIQSKLLHAMTSSMRR